MSSKIIDLLQNTEKRRQIEVRAWEFAKKYFNCDYVYRELKEVLVKESDNSIKKL